MTIPKDISLGCNAEQYSAAPFFQLLLQGYLCCVTSSPPLFIQRCVRGKKYCAHKMSFAAWSSSSAMCSNSSWTKPVSTKVSAIKSLVIISVSSQVHHSDKILYSVLAFKFNAIQSKALAVQQKYIAFSELQCSIECYGIVLCSLFQLLDEKDCTKLHSKCSVE